jgi:hypothetical protein
MSAPITVRPGERFGRLRVIKTLKVKAPFVGRPDNERKALRVKCDCGTTKTIFQASVTSGGVVSCGCHSREVLSEARYQKRHGQSSGRDGTPASETYKAWTSMRSQAHRKGIAVDRDWTVFENFVADMGERPAGYWLKRLRKEVGYEPRNCRWTKYSDKVRKKRLARTGFGTPMSEQTIAEIAERIRHYEAYGPVKHR